MKDSRPWLLALPWLLTACSTCGTDAPTRSEQAPSPAPVANPSITVAPSGPRPEGTPVSTDVLQRFAPDSFAGATAEGPSNLQQMPLANGGQMTLVRRMYKQGDVQVQLEISDMLHAEGLRHVVADQQGVKRQSAQNTFRGEAIGGQPALRQWHGPSHIALVNLLVADRFLINVRVSPASTDEPAVSAAKTLPLTEIAALAEPSAAGTDAPATVGSATPPPAASKTPAASPKPSAKPSR
jgi:hypothetical protein